MASLAVLSAVIVLIIGFPIWIVFSVGGLIILLFSSAQALSTFPQAFFQAMESYSLLAVPFFLLAGQLMARSGASSALYQWMDKMVGHLPGGLAMAAVFSCMFFGTISGSTLATMAAIGSMAIPTMLEKGYDKKMSVALLAASGGLGNLIPPSIGCVLFGSLTGAPIEKLFVAGIVPGITLAFFLVITVGLICRIKGYGIKPPASWKDRWESTLKALPALSVPVVVLGGIYGGMMTPVEAAGVACVWSLPVAAIYKSLSWKQIWEALSRAITTSTMIYFILGGCVFFVHMLTYVEVPQKLINFITAANLSQNMLLLLMFLLLFFLGMIMEPVPILFLVVPLTASVVLQSGIHYMTFNFLMIATGSIGFCTPPVAMALFVMSEMFHVRIETLARAIVPFLIVLVIHCLFFIFFPKLILWLPELIWGEAIYLPLST